MAQETAPPSGPIRIRRKKRSPDTWDLGTQGGCQGEKERLKSLPHLLVKSGLVCGYQECSG